MRVILALFALQLGCSATVDQDEPVARIDEPIWGQMEATAEGVRAPVCIPMGDQCLRLSVLINTQDRLDDAVVTGELVDHGCAATPTPITTVDVFHGTAFTGHGTLWLDGSTTLANGTSLDLAVEAMQGDCR